MQIYPEEAAGTVMVTAMVVIEVMDGMAAMAVTEVMEATVCARRMISPGEL